LTLYTHLQSIIFTPYFAGTSSKCYSFAGLQIHRPLRSSTLNHEEHHVGKLVHLLQQENHT
jgi:hypothetical protein